MRKLLLSVTLTLGAAFVSIAQVQCNDSLINANPDLQFGAFPDTTTNFGPAFVNTNYIQNLHFRIPTDAGAIVPDYAGAQINYFTVTDVTGLPGTGVFDYECSVILPNPCRFMGGTWGCARITNTGTIDASLIGTHNITIAVSGNVSLVAGLPGVDIPYSFSGYRLKIYPEDQLGTSIAEYDFATIYPNPATSQVFFNNLEDAQSIKFFNVAGQEVKTIVPTSSQLTVDVADLTTGTYMVYIFGKNGAHVQKLIKD